MAAALSNVHPELEELQQVIKSLVIPRECDGGATFRDISNDYKELEGSDIPYSKYGFPSLRTFLISNHFQGLFTLASNKDGFEVLRPKMDEKTAHIQKLVRGQDKGKKKSRKPARNPVLFTKPMTTTGIKFKTGQSSNQSNRNSNNRGGQNRRPVGNNNFNWAPSLFTAPSHPTNTWTAKPATIKTTFTHQPVQQQQSSPVVNRTKTLTAPSSWTCNGLFQARDHFKREEEEKKELPSQSSPVKGLIPSPPSLQKIVPGRGRATSLASTSSSSSLRHPVPVPGVIPSESPTSSIKDPDTCSLLFLRCLQSVYKLFRNSSLSLNTSFRLDSFVKSYASLFPAKASSLSLEAKVNSFEDITSLLSYCLESCFQPNPLLTLTSGSNDSTSVFMFNRGNFVKFIRAIQVEVSSGLKTSQVLSPLIPVDEVQKILAENNGVSCVGRRFLEWFYAPFLPSKQEVESRDYRSNFSRTSETLSYRTLTADNDVLVNALVEDLDLIAVPSEEELTPVEALVDNDPSLYKWSEVCISSVTSPVNLHVIKKTDAEKFDEMFKRLKDFYEGLPNDSKNLYEIPEELWQTGLVVIVARQTLSLEKEYLRGMIYRSSEDSNLFRIHLLDTGGALSLNNRMTNIPGGKQQLLFFKRSLADFKGLAIKTALLGVCPPVSSYANVSQNLYSRSAAESLWEKIATRGFPSQATSYLTKLSTDGYSLAGCFFQSSKESTHSFICQIKDEEEEDEYLHESLIDNGLGDSIGQEMTVALLRGVKDFKDIVQELTLQSLREE